MSLMKQTAAQRLWAAAMATVHSGSWPAALAPTLSGRLQWRIQLVNATVWLNISAGVWKPSVFLGLLFNCLANPLSLACE
jgi:hypothetical protein